MKAYKIRAHLSSMQGCLDRYVLNFIKEQLDNNILLF